MNIDNLCYMKEYLEVLSEKGAKLFLEDRSVTPDEMAWTCCVNENDIYMPDIIQNEDGRVAEVRYNKISRI